MKRAAREIRDLFLGPVDGDPFEQKVPRAVSALLLVIVGGACLLQRCIA